MNIFKLEVINLRYNLIELFSKLCSKYNLHNCEFIMAGHATIIKSDYYANKYYILTNKQMLNSIDYNHYLYYHSLMRTNWVWSNGKLKFRTIFPVENYLNLIYTLLITNNIDKSDDILEYMHITLEHEVGHIIHISNDYNKYFAKKDITFEAIQEWCKRHNTDKELQKYYKDYNQLYQQFENEEITEDDYIDKKTRLYFNMPSEKAANKAIDLDIEKLIKLNMKYLTSIEDSLCDIN